MSRVIARGLSSPTSESEKLRTFVRQLVFAAIQVWRRSANFGRSRKRCVVSRNSGVLPSMIERGSIRSVGSSWFPQLSHLSPRASG
jgi:hypothetical protein